MMLAESVARGHGEVSATLRFMQRALMRIAGAALLCAGLLSCGVAEVETRLNPDLSGRMSILMVSPKGTKKCEDYGKAIPETVKKYMLASSSMKDVPPGTIDFAPYSDSKWVGGKILVRFADIDELDVLLAKLREVEVKVGDETVKDVFPVDYRLTALPPTTEEGVTTWEVRVQGDPRQLTTGQLFKECHINTLLYRLVMPAPLATFSAEPPSISGKQLDRNTVEWSLSKDQGPVTLQVIARTSSASNAVDSEKQWLQRVDLAKGIVAFLTGLVALLAGWTALRKRKAT